MEDNLRVGSQVGGTLTSAAGGLGTAGGSVTISGRTVGSGAITVSGADGAGSASALDAGDELAIASYGTGALTISDGGAVSVGSKAYIGFYADSIGTLTIGAAARSEEHTSELKSLMRISYAVFCLTQKK